MKRVYNGSNSELIKERQYYELREPPAPSPDRLPDLYRTRQPTASTLPVKPATPSFTIPSSSSVVTSPPPESTTPHYSSDTALISRPHTSYSSVTTPPPPHPHHPPPPPDYYSSPRNLHCIVIADHIMDCPLCSRFYRNYTPLYNTIIILLIIVILVMIYRCRGSNSVLTSSPRLSSSPFS